ncbi:MAG TPA: cellulase family glycosylhydrolase, partial [Rhodanobacteraceae bacterium]|nr:cellulase family glycosylhydrolase [Rhodanobacteraceae bacterium]
MRDRTCRCERRLRPRIEFHATLSGRTETETERIAAPVAASRRIPAHHTRSPNGGDMRRTGKRTRILAATIVACIAASANAAVEWTGVNLAGAEFDSGTFWPNANEIQYFRAAGMNVVRVPFRWERLQPALSGALDATQLAALRGIVDNARNAGV